MEVSVAQSWPALCHPVDCSPPGSSVHGILQAGILEWVTIPLPGDFPDPGIKSGSPALQADSLLSEPQGKPRHKDIYVIIPKLISGDMIQNSGYLMVKEGEKRCQRSC